MCERFLGCVAHSGSRSQGCGISVRGGACDLCWWYVVPWPVGRPRTRSLVKMRRQNAGSSMDMVIYSQGRGAQHSIGHGLCRFPQLAMAPYEPRTPPCSCLVGGPDKQFERCGPTAYALVVEPRLCYSCLQAALLVAVPIQYKTEALWSLVLPMREGAIEVQCKGEPEQIYY